MTKIVDRNGYTSANLKWTPWLDAVDLGDATTEQLEVLTESGPLARDSAYFRTLVHHPGVLRHRSQVYNAIMYAPGGLPRAERELASTTVSRVNGCVYCASVHAQRFQQLARRSDVIEAIFDDPATAGETPRERAIIEMSITLTLRPETVDVDRINRLREVGLSTQDILDLIHCVAIFAWANRLMMNLGEHLRAD